MRTQYIRSVLEYHLSLLAAENSTFGCAAPEETRVGVLGVVHFLPLEVVGQGSWVDYVETFGVFDLGSHGLELDDVVLGLDVGLLLPVLRWRDLEVADGSVGLAV